MCIPKAVLSILSKRGIPAITKTMSGGESLAFNMGGKTFKQFYNKSGELTDYLIAGSKGYKHATISRSGGYTSCLFGGRVYPRGNYDSSTNLLRESCIDFQGASGVMKLEDGTFRAFSTQCADVIGENNYIQAYDGIAQSMSRDIRTGSWA